MTDKDIKAGLAGLDPKHPALLAVGELVTQSHAAESLAVAQPGLSDGDRHFNAGRLAAMIDFKNLFENTIQLAQEEREKHE